MSMYKLNLPGFTPELRKSIINKVETLYDENKHSSKFVVPWNYREGENIAHFLNFPQLPGAIPEIDAVFAMLPWDTGYSLTIMKNLDPTSTAYLVPHFDTRRNVAFNFLLDDGGPQVDTWYVNPTDAQRDQQAIRDSYEIKESYILDASNWYLFDSRSLHGVSNIQTARIIISATTNDRSIPFQEIVKQLGELVTYMPPDLTVKRRS